MRLLVATLMLGSALALPARQYDPFAEARTLTLDGTSLAYVERGAGGTPLVFVHGTGADLRTFGYQLQFFERSRKVIVYSRRFHHPNPPPAASAVYRLEEHVADLAALVGQLARGRADVVATSSGGLIAALLALEHPARVRKLVLVEPVAFGLLRDQEAGTALAALETSRRQLREGATEAALRTFVGVIIAPGAYDFMPASTRQMLSDNLPELAAEARAPLPGMEPPVTCAQLAGVRAPTLVVTGGNSATFFKAMSRRVHACIPGAAEETIPGAAHGVHAQQAEAFNQRIRTFLDTPDETAVAPRASLYSPP
jgi:pimeloyl-ACP methyl ester carboxylesterase